MSNSPIKVIRAGYVKATIWENTNDKGQVYHSIDISRSYRDSEGKWQDTNQMFTEQLPLVRVVSDNSYAFIHEHLNEIRAERKSDEQQKAEEGDKPAPAKKQGQKKTQVEKLEDQKSTAKSK